MGPLRSAQARTRPRREIPKPSSIFGDSDRDDLEYFHNAEPPSKRIRTSRKAQQTPKWIPGGRGGGGRHVDNESTPSATRSSYATDEYTVPRTRSRPSRDRKRTMTSIPRYSARSRNRGSTRP